MTRDDLDARLESVAASVPSPDPAFADRLEARLTAVHHLGADDPAPTPVRRAWLRPLLAAACVIAVLAAVALAVPSTDDQVLALDAASDARVVLPDGSVVDAEAGLELPDGTTITAGDEALVIDGTTVDPGETVVIRDGEVRFETSPTDDTVAAPPAGSGSDRPTTDATTTTTVTRSGDDPPDRTSPTIVAAPPAQPAPPASTPTTRPPASTTTTTSRPAEPKPLALTASRVGDRRVALAWTAYRSDDFARVVVVRTVSTGTGPPPRPVGPADGTVVLTSTDPRTLGARDTLPPGATAAAYRVFVLDASGGVIGISNIAAG